MTDWREQHLKQLEHEAIHIIREVVAEFQNPGNALFGRKRFFVHDTIGPESLLSGEIPFPSHACGHGVQISGDVSIQGQLR